MTDGDENDSVGTGLGNPAPFSGELSASKGLQAEHMVADDTPVDINQNATLGRVQAQTSALIGAEFGACAARRTIIADKAMP